MPADIRDWVGIDIMDHLDEQLEEVWKCPAFCDEQEKTMHTYLQKQESNDATFEVGEIWDPWIQDIELVAYGNQPMSLVFFINEEYRCCKESC